MLECGSVLIIVGIRVYLYIFFDVFTFFSISKPIQLILCTLKINANFNEFSWSYYSCTCTSYHLPTINTPDSVWVLEFEVIDTFLKINCALS